MALKIIVSYDDTDNDRDALALGRLLAYSGGELALAYVRHSFGESLEQQQAEELLARGAASVGTPEMPKHVVVNPATSVGLTELAEKEQADVIAFGSEYRTAAGLVKPGISAHKLLLGGPSAIAVALPGSRQPVVSVSTVGVIDEGDPSARETAARASPGRSVRGSPTTAPGRSTSSSSARGPRRPHGRVVLSAKSDYAVEARELPGAGDPARGLDRLRRRGAPAAVSPRAVAGRPRSRPRPPGRGCRSARSAPEVDGRRLVARGQSATVFTAESVSITSAAGPAFLRRAPPGRRRALRAVTSSEARSAFAQPWPNPSSGLLSSGPSRTRSSALFVAPNLRSPKSTCRPESQGSSTA